MSDFDTFYKRFPRRIKPFNARKAYDKAMKRATHEEVMEGLERFIAAEPWHGELQFCPHPATWMNAGQWMDEYEPDSPGKDMSFDERREVGEQLVTKMQVVK